MDFEAWRTNVISAARRAANREYQQRVWFGHGPERDSPDDLFCTFLGDLVFDDFLRHPMLSSPERTAAMRLYQVIEEYAKRTPKHLEPSDVIDDPRFEDVRNAAKDFLRIAESHYLGFE